MIHEISCPVRPDDATHAVLRQVDDLPESFFSKAQPEHVARRFLARTATDGDGAGAMIVCEVPHLGKTARVWVHFAKDVPVGEFGELLASVDREVGNAVTQLIAVVEEAAVEEEIEPKSTDGSEPMASNAYLANGFSPTTRILHLVLLSASFRSRDGKERVASRVVLQSVLPPQLGRFTDVLRESFQGSADCPQLDFMTDAEQIVSEWKQTSPTGRNAYLFLVLTASVESVPKTPSSEIGCLVLNESLESGRGEIVYMGLTSSYREQGYGGELLDLAVQQLKTDRITLSVDVTNEAAVACYISRGFVRYAESTVYVRRLRS